MKRLLTFLICLLPLAAQGQTPFAYTGRTGSPTVAGDSLKLSEAIANGATKQDINGNVSGQHALAAGTTNLRTLADKLGDLASPADYLLPGETSAQLYSGAVDAAGPILATVAAKGVAGLPCGRYRLDTPLTLNSQAIRGMGRACVTLVVNFPAGDIVTIPVKSVGASIEQTHWVTAMPHTSGDLWHVVGANDTTILHTLVSADGGTFSNLLTVDAGAVLPPATAGPPADGITVDDGKWSGATGSGIILRGYAQDVHVNRLTTVNLLHNFYFEFASGITMADDDFIGATSDGCIFSPSQSTGENVNGVLMTKIYCDSSYGAGWLFTNNGAITEVHGSDIWGTQAGVTNLYGENPNPSPKHGAAATAPWTQYPNSSFLFNNPNINGIELDNIQAHLSGGIGIDIEAGNNIRLNGGFAFQNSYICYSQGSCPGGIRYPGIKVAAAANHVSLLGLTSGVGGLFASLGSLTSYGFEVDSGGSTGHVITLLGNQAPGNVAGGRNIAVGPNDHVVGAPGSSGDTNLDY